MSINTLTAISLERLIVIAWSRLQPPFNRSQPWKITAISLSIWIYSGLWAMQPLVGWGAYILEGSRTSCTFDFFTRSASNRAFVISIFVFCFGIQLCIISVSYLMIFIKVFRHEREALYYSEGNRMVCIRAHTKIKSAKVQVKIAKVVLLIVTVFCVSWVPYAVVALIGMFGDASVITRLTSAIPGTLAKLSTAVNPIIYALIHPKFKNKLRYCICRTRDNLDESRSRTTRVSKSSQQRFKMRSTANGHAHVHDTDTIKMSEDTSSSIWRRRSTISRHIKETEL